MMILCIFVTMHAHWVNSTCYNFFEDNENVLPTATWEIQILLHLPLMEMKIKKKRKWKCQKLIRSILKREEDVKMKVKGIQLKENVV